ncbi:MAG: hypothetical protein LBM78_01965, partial [Clostridiales bacterium]|nr:hypothetical protein [Clostridiales bacterium]
MIKGITAYTAEIDDVEAAVGSILSQLTAQATLTPDMAGVVFCSFDFAESGVLAALEAALPFGILGITSVSQAAGTMSEQLMLSVTVYYGDGIVFKPGTSEELPDKGDISTLIADGYRAAKKDFPYQEKLIFAFAPLQPYHAGDE